MPGTLYKPKEVKDLIDDEIKKLGAGAFGPNHGFAQLYSGPWDKVTDQIIGYNDLTDSNRVRAYAQAGTRAIILEKTPIGIFAEEFEGVGLYAYFLGHPHIDPAKRADVATDLFRHISRKFVETLYGEVSAAVCGASHQRVFYYDELPTIARTIPLLISKMLKSDDIIAVNQVPTRDIRRIFRRQGPDAAFAQICRGDIQVAHEKAHRTHSAIDFKDCLGRSEFYMVERELTLRDAGLPVPPIFSMTPDERADWKMEQLQDFVAGSLIRYMDEIDAVGRSSVLPRPASRRVAVPRLR